MDCWARLTEFIYFLTKYGTLLTHQELIPRFDYEDLEEQLLKVLQLSGTKDCTRD